MADVFVDYCACYNDDAASILRWPYSPDAILSISPNATQQQLRDAYKRAALKSHPDRVPTDSPERPARTKQFQQINDAYYTLSDSTRRRDYDAARAYHFGSGGTSSDADEEIPRPPPNANAGGFPWSAFGFGGGKASDTEEEKFSNEQFGSVFEEMLREEGLAEGREARPTGKFWSLVGGLSGGAMGFIIANFTGAVAGAVAGNRLGAIRDARGKSVYTVFQELPQSDKSRLLSELATKVFATALSG
jgi:curved DNA-binding protein CbpA